MVLNEANVDRLLSLSAQIEGEAASLIAKQLLVLLGKQDVQQQIQLLTEMLDPIFEELSHRETAGQVLERLCHEKPPQEVIENLLNELSDALLVLRARRMPPSQILRWVW